MIKFQEAELHNIEELVFEPETGDYRMERLPLYVKNQLNEKAENNTSFVSNSEIRFVMLGEEVSVNLRRAPVRGAILDTGIAQVFQGDFQGSYEISPFPVSTEGNCLRIRRQNFSHIEAFSSEDAPKGFAPTVTRVLLPYDWGCSIKSIEGQIRPPFADEMPSRRLLVYGSSITHGGNVSSASHTYAFGLARELGMDLINLGCAGSAQMDSAMAEYIGERDDWDCACLELGVNVLESWDWEKLYQSVYSFISCIKEKKPDQLVVVTDMFYNHHDFWDNPKCSAFREAVRRCVESLSDRFKELYYICGLELMDCPEDLSSDGLHPSDEGHRKIAFRLAEYIKAVI